MGPSDLPGEARFLDDPPRGFYIGARAQGARGAGTVLILDGAARAKAGVEGAG